MSNNRRQQREQKRQRDLVISKALRNRDETREKLLSQGRELARRRAENIEQNQKRSEDAPNTTNPSVHSTLPAMDTNEEVATQHSHSAVPPRPKGSTVPAADRLYGIRLYERLRSRNGGEETTPAAVSESDSGATEQPASGDDEAATEGGDR